MTHEEQRKQVWANAYTKEAGINVFDYEEDREQRCLKFANGVLKAFDDRFSEKSNEYDLKAKQEINKRINELQEDYGQVMKSLNIYSHDTLIMEIHNLKERSMILDNIEQNYVVQRSDTEIRVIPRSKANNNPKEPDIHRIIPEPPRELPRVINEGQQPKQTLPLEHWEDADDLE